MWVISSQHHGHLLQRITNIPKTTISSHSPAPHGFIPQQGAFDNEQDSEGCIAPIESEDPYAYANGHWLHRDKEQRQARQLDFNFSGLSQIALDAIKDATRIISYEKEGGYNRVFNFKLDNGDQVVTKIPTLVAGAPWLTVNSEVATV